VENMDRYIERPTEDEVRQSGKNRDNSEMFMSCTLTFVVFIHSFIHASPVATCQLKNHFDIITCGFLSNIFLIIIFFCR